MKPLLQPGTHHTHNLVGWGSPLNSWLDYLKNLRKMVRPAIHLIQVENPAPKPMICRGKNQRALFICRQYVHAEYQVPDGFHSVMHVGWRPVMVTGI
mmetsp:Transcript_122183/g.211960  ORF Transcript_122183/g.211960 Transcript_122183/m.211960 type:complete len:97 (+) Transcript_122183:431-721(+)